MHQKKPVFVFSNQKQKLFNFFYSFLILLAVIFLVFQFFIVREPVEKVGGLKEVIGRGGFSERASADTDLFEKSRNASFGKGLQKSKSASGIRSKERLSLIAASASAGLRAGKLVDQSGVARPGGYVVPNFNIGADGKRVMGDISILNSSPIVCGLVNDTRANVDFVFSDSSGVVLDSGFEVVSRPVSPKCAGETLFLTFSVPQNFEDLSVLRCSGVGCEPVGVDVDLREVWCGNTSASGARKKAAELKPSVVRPDEWGVKFGVAELVKPDKNYVVAGNYLFSFPSVVNSFVLKADSPSFDVNNPVSPSLYIIGAPVVFRVVNGSGVNVSAVIRFENPKLNHFDSASLGFYVKSKDGWTFLGGSADESGVVLEVDDLSSILDGDRSAVLSVMGLLCISCDTARLDKVWAGKSRDAVVFVHGLFSGSLTWQSLIDDFVMTRQPWQVWSLNFPYKKDTHTIAVEFFNELEFKSSEFDNLVLVGHSFGGFVIQHVLDLAVERNASFLNKLRKVVLVGSPNDGSPVLGQYKNFYKFVVNSKEDVWLFDVKDHIIDELIHGLDFSNLDNVLLRNVSYYSIAGNLPYVLNLSGVEFSSNALFDFKGPNDGVTSVRGAQHLGDSYLDDYCKNFYEVSASHTDLTSNAVTRRVVSRIVSEDWINRSIDTPLIGFNKYVRVSIPACLSGEKYVVVGRKISFDAVEAPLNCACGNGICNIGENVVSCSGDCSS